MFASPMPALWPLNYRVGGRSAGQVRFVKDKKTDDGGDISPSRPMATCRLSGSTTAGY